MSLQAGFPLPRGHVPQLHRTVLTAAGQCLAIGTEGNAINLESMSLEPPEALPRVFVPESYTVVPSTGRGELPAVRAECHAVQTVAGPFQEVSGNYFPIRCIQQH